MLLLILVMIVRFKKIYIEITNRCNLNCQFCIGNKRKINDISISEYIKIIKKIKGYTKEIYLHILGEPLMHKNINFFIDYAHQNGLMVNITTNGYLISKIKDNHNLNRLNVSLHSYNSRYGVSFDNYMDNIFEVIDILRNNGTFVTLRLWGLGNNVNDMLEYINNQYNTNISFVKSDKKIKIAKNLIIDFFHEFIWPDLNNNYYNEYGTCMGLINHIGILSDGRIVPCCLDTNGIIALGNIYEDNLDEVLGKDIVKEMIHGFKNNYKCQELCKHCSFLENNNK